MSLSADIQQLLDNVIDTLVKWDMVTYLQKNPSNRVSAEELASSLGRTADEVILAFSELSESGIVQYENDGEAIYYRFNPNKTWQKSIEQFSEAQADRNIRWLILNYLIEKHELKQSS